MLSKVQPSIKAFTLLVFALVFTSAWPFWTSLMDGQVLDGDLIAPIAYGFAALAGAIALVKLSFSSRQTGILRWFYILGALILLIAPFIFFFLRSPLLEKVVPIKYWIISAAMLVGMITLLITQKFTSLQKVGLVFSIVMGIISPVMPWAQLVLFSPTYPLGNFTWAFATYGLWLTAAVWAGTAWLMLREQLQGMQKQLTAILLAGLALFQVGIFNPVQYSSQTYLQSTYIGGSLVDRGYVDIGNINVTLFAGMGLILFALLLMTLSGIGKVRINTTR